MKNHELSSHELRFFQSHWCHWWPFWIRVLKFQFHSITSDPLIQYWSDVMLSEIWLELQFLEHKLVVNSSELGHNSWLTSIYLSICLYNNITIATIWNLFKLFQVCICHTTGVSWIQTPPPSCYAATPSLPVRAGGRDRCDCLRHVLTALTAITPWMGI